MPKSVIGCSFDFTSILNSESLGLVASVIGAYYYIRIVYFMYFGAESEPLDTQTPRRLTVILVASTAVITVGAAFSLFGIEPLAQLAAESLAN